MAKRNHRTSGSFSAGFVFLLLLVGHPAFGSAGLLEKKVALVIGNSAYPGDEVSGEKNAISMVAVLRQLGFTVPEPVLNKETVDEITPELTVFGKEIKDASVVVFFYSGHGFQRGGENYLMPTHGGYKPKTSLPLGTVLQTLGLAPDAAVKLVFIDACRTPKSAPSDLEPGLAKPGPSPIGVLQAFAASPDQPAVSGAADSLSPYTQALLRHIKEPGLDLLTFLTRVREEVSTESFGEQLPTEEGLSGIPSNFYLRRSVLAQASLEGIDDDLTLLVNGNIVLTGEAEGKGPQPFTLRAGHNPLLILVSNQATRHNGQSWERTEGWSYKLRLFGPGGTELTAPGCAWSKPCFADNEDVPFKDGPHHGKTFVVATADLYVDPQTAGLELREVNTKVWKNGAPLWAQQQEILYEIPVRSFPISKIVGLPFGIDIMDLIRNVQNLLVTFHVGEVKLPDFDSIVGVVRGNGTFRGAVIACMDQDRADREADLKKSVDALKAGNAKPFGPFDDSLAACVSKRVLNQVGNTLRPEDIKVWTAFEDRSR
jgi:hypothetical protein